MENQTITAEIAKQILIEAAARGVSVESLLQSVIEIDEKVEEESKQKLTPQERAKIWREWVDSHSYITAPPLSDYAVSRESIYAEREDSQL